MLIVSFGCFSPFTGLEGHFNDFLWQELIKQNYCKCLHGSKQTTSFRSHSSNTMSTFLMDDSYPMFGITPFSFLCGTSYLFHEEMKGIGSILTTSSGRNLRITQFQTSYLSFPSDIFGTLGSFDILIVKLDHLIAIN